MSSSDRLFYPLDAALIPVPTDAPICIWRAKPSAALSRRSGVSAVQSFKPYVTALGQMGIPVITEPDTPLTLAGVEITRSKAETLGLIAQAVSHVTPGGWCLVDGSKTDGIESVFKALKSAFDYVESYSKSHGRVCWLQVGDDPPERLDQWRADAAARTIQDGYVTVPGIFSEKGTDAGSAFLLDALPAHLGGMVADLGAGWGWLSAEALKKAPGIQELHLFEAEALALTCARQNVTDPRAKFHWSDATQDSLGAFDTMIMNPPFHTARTPDPQLGQRFITAASKALKRSGELFMVANRHLPYEQILNSTFSHWEETATNARFKVIHAKRPKSASGS